MDSVAGMTKKPFNDAGKKDALDIKADELEAQIYDKGWGGALEVYRELAAEQTELNQEQQKILLLDYLSIFLEWKTKHPNKGERYLMMRVQQEISEARTDKLTGIANKRAFDEKFETEQAVISRFNAEEGRNKPYVSSVVSFDVNGLKKVNDELGHLAGDEFIKHFATVVQSVLRPNEPLFRIGGDEFILILSNADTEQAQNAIVRIRKALDEKKFIHDGHEISIKTSAGIAEIRLEKTKDEVLKEADVALYVDKEAQPKSTWVVSGSAPSGGDVLSFPMR